MPTYEFRCSNGHTVEQFHKISDAPSAVACPECGAVAERAISGGAGLVFKGSGFYLTDYGKNAHRSSGPSKGGESTGESKSEGKSEAKSEGGAAPAKSETGGSSAPAPPSGGSGSGASGGKSDAGGSKGAA